MQLPKSIRDNLRFLVVEVDSQLAKLQVYFSAPSAAIARRILDRSGYAYNLKMRIHDSCLRALAAGGEGDSERLTLRGVEFIATELERIAELCRDCVKQMGYLSQVQHLEPVAYGPMLDRVRNGVELVEPAIHENDTQLALKIGQIEAKLDRDYNRLLKRYVAALKQKRHTEDLTRALFVAHSVEQMGDALLDISESILSANLGQPLNIDRYYSLQASVEKLDAEELTSEVQIEPIAETRSGSAISGISAPDSGDDEYVAIFKDGEKRKLKEERQGVESWHEIYPGLAPKILSYKKRGQSAALLIEHLPGLTFEQILLNEPPQLLQEALGQLARTLKSVWRETRTGKPVSADFVAQLQNRLPDVYKIHPEFRQGTCRVCGFEVASFDSLLKEAAKYEAGLRAPFSVYIHGDFNVDNIIYDPMEKRINFIDLHRSRYMDYVQDVSVFMVSNYRLQILDIPLRRRIMQMALDFYRVARRYADKVGDDTFELRLALGLARSFATSTRFILDKSLARRMFLRARYLIELVLDTDPKKAVGLRIPLQEIFVG
jgi:hypothetical protein